MDVPGDQSRAGLVGDEECRLLRGAVELAGRKWNTAVMLAIESGADRFSIIRRGVPGVSDRVLAARLRELETHALVEREVIPTHPVQVRYTLTAAGADLIQALRPLGGWSRRWITKEPLHPRSEPVDPLQGPRRSTNR